MRITRIYCDSPLATGAIVALQEKASHHLCKVLRQKPGDTLIVFCGDGREFKAEISAVDKKLVTIAVGESSAPGTESPLLTHLGIGISKGDKMDWVLQKSTELGVSAITPLLSQRTEFKLKGERLDKKMNHWQQVIISACEQCGRNTLPALNPPETTDSWVSRVEAGRKYVLHPQDSQAGQPPPKTGAVDSVALLVGPEGGLSENEVAVAIQHRFSPLLLGPRVMRTETAPVAVLAVLQATWGDFESLP